MLGKGGTRHENKGEMRASGNGGHFDQSRVSLSNRKPQRGSHRVVVDGDWIMDWIGGSGPMESSGKDGRAWFWLEMNSRRHSEDRQLIAVRTSDME